MTYKTLMVWLQLDSFNTALLNIVDDIGRAIWSKRYRNRCVPTHAVAVQQLLCPSELIEQESDEITNGVKAAEPEFRTTLQGRVSDIRFRSMMVLDSLGDYVATEARSADLVITNMHRGPLFEQRGVNVGDLIMRVGRPVLIAPPASEAIDRDHVIIGWKDTQEARCAVVDALPFLREAAHVPIVEIAEESGMIEARQRLQHVVGWLKRHGVAAESIAAPATGEDTTQLNAMAEEQKADLIVARAYGHSRLREWAFGGVTRDILIHADRRSLVSH